MSELKADLSQHSKDTGTQDQLSLPSKQIIAIHALEGLAPDADCLRALRDIDMGKKSTDQAVAEAIERALKAQANEQQAR